MKTGIELRTITQHDGQENMGLLVTELPLTNGVRLLRFLAENACFRAAGVTILRWIILFLLYLAGRMTLIMFNRFAEVTILASA